MAMNMGADDYIHKPFHTDVLLAKIQALFRRTYAYGEEAPDVLEWNGAMIDMKRGVIRIDGNEDRADKERIFHPHGACPIQWMKSYRAMSLSGSYGMTNGSLMTIH